MSAEVFIAELCERGDPGLYCQSIVFMRINFHIFPRGLARTHACAVKTPGGQKWSFNNFSLVELDIRWFCCNAYPCLSLPSSFQKDNNDTAYEYFQKNIDRNR